MIFAAETFGQGKADAVAGLLRPVDVMGRIAPIKAVEKALIVDAGAIGVIVGDTEQNRFPAEAALVAIQPQADGAAVVTVFDGVVQQDGNELVHIAFAAG